MYYQIDIVSRKIPFDHNEGTFWAISRMKIFDLCAKPISQDNLGHLWIIWEDSEAIHIINLIRISSHYLYQIECIYLDILKLAVIFQRYSFITTCIDSKTAVAISDFHETIVPDLIIFGHHVLFLSFLTPTCLRWNVFPCINFSDSLSCFSYDSVHAFFKLQLSCTALATAAQGFRWIQYL